MNILQIVNRSKASWTGQILRRNSLLKHVIEGNVEGRIEVTWRRGRICRQLLDEIKEKIGNWKIGRGSTRSHCVGNSIGKRLWTCRKTDCGMNGICKVVDLLFKFVINLLTWLCIYFCCVSGLIWAYRWQKTGTIRLFRALPRQCNTECSIAVPGRKFCSVSCFMA
jgi:hypothetical protein